MDFFNFNAPTSSFFERHYRCFSVAVKGKAQLESGGKIILPPSALDRLAHLRIEYPMIFQLKNPNNQNTTHCGVMEFVAEEGICYVPYWMMQLLGVEEGGLIVVKSTQLPRGNFVKLQPHTSAFIEISNPKAVLEHLLRNFAALTKGDVIVIHYNNKKYPLNVLEVKPGSAVSIMETDMDVDFAPPLDYQEKTPAKAIPTQTAPQTIPTQSSSSTSSAGNTPTSTSTTPTFSAFTGSGYRLDGKILSSGDKKTATATPSSTPTSLSSSPAASTTTSSSSSSSTALPGPKLIFGASSTSTSTTSTSNTAKVPPPSSTTTKQATEKEAEQKSFVPFSGTGYRLR